MNYWRQLIVPSAILIGASSTFGAPGPANCSQLAELKLPHATITHAQIVHPGEFKLPSESTPPSSDFFTGFDKMQAFCRVEGVSRPTSDSHIEFEVWLPETGWNAKY